MSAARPGGQPGAVQMSAGSQDVRRRIMAVPPQQQQAPTPGWKALPPTSTPMTPYQQQRKFTTESKQNINIS